MQRMHAVWGVDCSVALTLSSHHCSPTVPPRASLETTKSKQRNAFFNAPTLAGQSSLSSLHSFGMHRTPGLTLRDGHSTCQFLEQPSLLNTHTCFLHIRISLVPLGLCVLCCRQKIHFQSFLPQHATDIPALSGLLGVLL